MSLIVRKPGLLSTIQDLGRPGHRSAGVSLAGAVDPFAAAVTNFLAGNPLNAPLIEITLVGPELEADEYLVVCLGGADLGAKVRSKPVALWQPFPLARGEVLRFSGRETGCRSYLALAGAVRAPRQLGSASSDVRSGLGAPALRAGDRIAKATEAAFQPRPLPPELLREIEAHYHAASVLRILPGPDAQEFAPEASRVLENSAFTVTPRSDRTGCRLSGPKIPAPPEEMWSDTLLPGHLQVPPNGQPILLLSECPTVGGYPRLASVLSADLTRAAQLGPGDRVSFRRVTLEEAVQARRMLESIVDRVKEAASADPR